MNTINKEFISVIRLLRENNVEYNSAFFYIDDCSQLSIDELEDCLHPIEKKRYSSFKSDVRQLSFALGRFCAKKAIGYTNNIHQLSEIHIDSGIFNQPIIKEPNLPNIRVSIAHDGLSAVAISYPEEHPMGVDIESIDDEKSEAVEEQLTDFERKLIKKLSTDTKTLNMIFWTAKESLSKVLKTGLMVPLSIFELDNIELLGSFYRGTFTNFYQYQFYSCIHHNKVISILLPRKTRLSLESTFSFS